MAASFFVVASSAGAQIGDLRSARSIVSAEDDSKSHDPRLSLQIIGASTCQLADEGMSARSRMPSRTHVAKADRMFPLSFF